MQNLPEAKATLLRTHKGVVKGQVASEAKSKAVVQVEVHCTPCSTFDDIIKQLEDPRLPTFKLTDLVRLAQIASSSSRSKFCCDMTWYKPACLLQPPATKEDLYRISSPRAPRASLQAPSQAVSLEEEIANFPLIHCPRVRVIQCAIRCSNACEAVSHYCLVQPDDRLSMLQLDDRARSMPLPPMKFEGGRALFYPDTAPSMPLPDQIGTWPSFVAEQPISSTLSQMTDEEEVTDPSDERPAKRAKLLTTGEKHGTDSSSDSGASSYEHMPCMQDIARLPTGDERQSACSRKHRECTPWQEADMPQVWDSPNTSVENWTPGAQDHVQCMWREVQKGAEGEGKEGKGAKGQATGSFICQQEG